MAGLIMRGRLGAMGVLLLAVACLLVTVAAEDTRARTALGLDNDALQRRVMHQSRNGTDSDAGSSKPNPARVTGALALYSLFGLFVFSSVVTCIVGIVVTVQWPNPRICCYRTPHSDIPSSESCGCCALHRLNIGFAVTWLALLVLLVLAFIIYLMAAAAVLAVAHSAIAYRLVRQLKQSYIVNSQMQMAAVLDARAPLGLVTGIVLERPLPGVPLPGTAVINIPLMVAVVGAQLQTHLAYAVSSAERPPPPPLAPGGSGGGAGAGGAGAAGMAGSTSARKSGGGAATGVGMGAGMGAGPAAAAGGGGGAGLAVIPVAVVVDNRIVPPALAQSPGAPGAAAQGGAVPWGGSVASQSEPVAGGAGPSTFAAAAAAAAAVGDTDSSYPLLQPPPQQQHPLHDSSGGPWETQHSGPNPPPLPTSSAAVPRTSTGCGKGGRL